MNVTVLGRIRPAIAEGYESSTSHSDANGESSVSFQKLYKQGDTNRVIYSDDILSMVNLLGAGFNCSVLCFGEAKSGKSYTLAGEGTGRPGIIQMVLKDVFKEVDYLYGNGHSAYVTMDMYELYNEMIRDLLSFDQQGGVCELDVNAREGVYVKNLTAVAVTSIDDALSVFRNGWLAQNSQNTDYGNASSRTTVVTRIHLTQEREEYSYPYKSTFTFVDLPGAEKLAVDPKALKRKEGTLLNKSILALGELIEELASKPGAERIVPYEASKLTNLLRDVLGGNCNTKVIVHQKPRSDPRVIQAMLNAAENFSKITNFCLLNDASAQGLVTQYRTQLINQQGQRVGSSIPSLFDSYDLTGTNAKLKKENMKLKEEEGYLRRRLDQMDSHLGDVAMAKTDISVRLISTEEEKLKVSKMLVDLQIENNRIKEKASEEIFELNNKLMSIDSDYRQVLIDKERLVKETRLARERLDVINRERQELADKYVLMKADYGALAEKYDSEVSRNQQLGLELLNLLNAKVTLLKQEENLARATDHKKEQTAEELSRARDIARGMSSRKIRAEEIGASDLDKQELQSKLFGDHDRMRSEYNKMRNQYNEQQDKLQNRIMELNATLKSARQTTRDCQHKLATQEVNLITSHENARELAVANSRLQTQLMEMNEEMRSRLTKYLEDIAEFVDDRDATLNRKMEDNLSNYVRTMMKNLKETYKTREKQLSDAARDFKAKMQSVGKKHEEVLVAFRFLRKQIQKSEIGNIDLGPEEGELMLKDDDVESANRREIRCLTEALIEAQTNPRPSDSDNNGGWNDFQKKLGEFTSKAQQELESERASLMSTNAILEEQLEECHDYINKHLNKYREENISLRRMLGMKDRDLSSYEEPPSPRGQRAGYARVAGPSYTRPNWQF